MSNLDYNLNENTLLIPMGIHTPSWNRLNDLFIINKFEPDNFPNYCFPKYIRNIINIKEFLSNNKRKVYNFEYTSMDYWIAEKIYDYIISPPLPSSSSGNGNGNDVQVMDLGGSKKNKTIKHKRNRKNKTNRNKRNRRNRRNKTIRKKRKRKNKTIKYI